MSLSHECEAFVDAFGALFDAWKTTVSSAISFVTSTTSSILFVSVKWSTIPAPNASPKTLIAVLKRSLKVIYEIIWNTIQIYKSQFFYAIISQCLSMMKINNLNVNFNFGVGRCIYNFVLKSVATNKVGLYCVFLNLGTSLCSYLPRLNKVFWIPGGQNN